MKKLLAILVLGLLFCNTSFARIDYGCGPLKFTETAVKHFHEYLTFKKRKTGEHESTEPDYPHWTVNHVNDYAVLFVVTDGLNSSGFGIYNFYIQVLQLHRSLLLQLHLSKPLWLNYRDYHIHLTTNPEPRSLKVFS